MSGVHGNQKLSDLGCLLDYGLANEYASVPVVRRGVPQESKY